MTAVTGAPVSRHGLGSDVPVDGAFSWTGTDLNTSVALANRTCISMCHGDHPHTVTSPAAAGHANNVFLDATTQATRAVTVSPLVGTGGTGTQNRARTDFDTTLNLGLCASCHQKPILANGITVSAATFGLSAHDFSSNTVGTTYTWSYGLHDASSFARNCTKCHASRVEGNTPASTTTLSVHYSTTDANLLAGTTNPAGTAAGARLLQLPRLYGDPRRRRPGQPLRQGHPDPDPARHHRQPVGSPLQLRHPAQLGCRVHERRLRQRARRHRRSWPAPRQLHGLP